MMQCVLDAWQAHEDELRRFLLSRLNDDSVADDLLQTLFLKALAQDDGFCGIQNPRAWLYQVARHLIADHYRRTPAHAPLDTLHPAPHPPEDPDEPLKALQQCVLNNLPYLDDADQAILNACDLEGKTVKSFAEKNGLSLPAAKSRLLRARQRLREQILERCQVRFDETGQVCCHVPPGTTRVKEPNPGQG